LEFSDAHDDLRAPAIEVLAATPQALRSLVAHLPGWLLEQPADADWSPKDVVAHLLISQEQGAFSRIRAIVEQEQPVLPNIDERRELERSEFRDWKPQDLIAALTAKRAREIAWLRTLEPAALTRIGWHSEVGSVTAEQLLYHAAYHDCLHLRQLLSMVERYLDPLRGAMRAY
jgi:hypothetical protein